MDILVVLLLSFEINFQHFHLVAQHLSLHRARLFDFDPPVANVAFFQDSPEAFVPDTIECFCEVDEVLISSI